MNSKSIIYNSRFNSSFSCNCVKTLQRINIVSPCYGRNYNEIEEAKQFSINLEAYFNDIWG